jgi:hypothetical protein
MFLHKPGDIPLVSDLGFALAPGMNYLVAVKTTEVSVQPFKGVHAVSLLFCPLIRVGMADAQRVPMKTKRRNASQDSGYILFYLV